MLLQEVEWRRKMHDDQLEALKAALEAMNYMGDILNGMDAATKEDIAFATPRFIKVREAIARAEGGAK